ncbi:hypothetical protein ACXDH4_003325 [Klebsiella variicola]
MIDYAFFHKSVPLNAWQLCMMKYHRISDLACNAQRCQQPAIDNANVQDYSPDYGDEIKENRFKRWL